jgi:hypothetical protein
MALDLTASGVSARIAPVTSVSRRQTRADGLSRRSGGQESGTDRDRRAPCVQWRAIPRSGDREHPGPELPGFRANHHRRRLRGWFP